MGTTAEKGAYIIETKSLLKDKINNLGGSIDDNTTFRQYANQLQNVYDNLPKTEYQEGTEITLSNTLKGKLDYDNGVVGIGQSSQATRQYIDVGTWEKGAIDGTTGLNGDNNSFVRTKEYIEVKPNVLYEMSRTIATDYMVFRFYDSNKSYLGSQATTGMVTTNRHEYNDRMTVGVTTMQLTINNTNVAYMRMVDASNDLSTIYTIYTDNTPSPSYPQTINSVTGNQDVVVSGKNLINLNNSENGGIDANGNLVVNTQNWRGTEYIPVKPNTQYTLSTIGYGSTTYILRLYQYDEDKTFITPRNQGENNTTLTITTGANTKYLKWTVYLGSVSITDEIIDLIQMMLCEGTSTTYEPYVTPKTYQLSLGDIELCGIGDYRDELIYDVENDRIYKNEKIGKVVLNGTEENWNKNSTRYSYNIGGYENGALQIYSNYFKGITSWNSHSSTPDTCILDKESSWDNARISFNAGNIASVTDGASWKTWLSTHNTEVCYPLATPVEKPITNTTLINQVKALYNAHSNNGTTIITSNGNLSMIIKVRGLKGE